MTQRPSRAHAQPENAKCGDFPAICSWTTTKRGGRANKLLDMIRFGALGSDACEGKACHSIKDFSKSGLYLFNLQYDSGNSFLGFILFCFSMGGNVTVVQSSRTAAECQTLFSD